MTSGSLTAALAVLLETAHGPPLPAQAQEPHSLVAGPER
jgi:hypothetical protein